MPSASRHIGPKYVVIVICYVQVICQTKNFLSESSCHVYTVTMNINITLASLYEIQIRARYRPTLNPNH